MDKFITIKEASVLIGVTTTTLWRWDDDGSLEPHHRTVGNHRRYKLRDILDFIAPNRSNEIRKTICYARVSTYDQKKDLDTQSEVLESYCKSKSYTNIEVIKDLGSGLNFKKKGQCH